MKTFTLNSMRITGTDKNYYMFQLEEFAARIVNGDNNIISVSFGKQDSRGALSITLFDNKHCVPAQKHFESKAALLGYVVGVNAAHSKEYDSLLRYAN